MLDIRLLAIDLDGTLLNGANRMSERTERALRAALARGIVVAAATARPYQAVARLFGAAGLPLPAIASGGSDVRLADGTVVRQSPLPDAFAHTIAETCDREGWVATLATPDRMYRRQNGVPEWAARAPEWIVAVENFAQGVPLPLLTALIDLPGVRAKLAPLDAFREQVAVHHATTFNGSTLMTYTALDADKGHGLRALCAHLGIEPRQAVAFGDSDVDVPMFEAAGLAIAMDNASDEAKARAHRVTGPVEDDGVAQAIEEMLA
jgi:hypothetical protein